MFEKKVEGMCPNEVTFVAVLTSHSLSSFQPHGVGTRVFFKSMSLCGIMAIDGAQLVCS
ncbi:hypothetical protein SLEP1_g59353 [Rubroshorea leprosula]|uniref:Uncharacterized protein n=1 Tax=Rubroshorea leprosula TaxID=152421 RepID=A0AAV5MTB6_9ROSI|nr:hypothetical protein SLEP1_g59353 [Rubroshorea leprosula]